MEYKLIIFAIISAILIQMFVLYKLIYHEKIIHQMNDELNEIFKDISNRLCELGKK